MKSRFFGKHALKRIERIADALLEKTTITYKDIEQIINEVGWKNTVSERERRKHKKVG